VTRLAVFNQKGGVGKTTTALNLAAALARRQLSPLLLDLDAQAHLSQILAPADGAADSVFAHAELMKVDSMFGRGPNVLNRLKGGLDDYPGAAAPRAVFIDCCPMLGVLSLSGVFAADPVLVPISADFLAMKGTRSRPRCGNASGPSSARRASPRVSGSPRARITARTSSRTTPKAAARATTSSCSKSCWRPDSWRFEASGRVLAGEARAPRVAKTYFETSARTSS
jgi:hypothetical protein